MGTTIKSLRSKLDNIALSLQQLKHNIVASKLKKKYPELRVFGEHEESFYSQMGQDQIIFKSFFKNKKDGVYCDVGGNHPIHFNNTKYFEEIGWSGYVFEPLPNMQPLWEEMRNAFFFPYAASNVDGEATLSIPRTKEKYADMFSQIEVVPDKKLKEKIKDIIVPTRSIRNVFKEKDIRHIDYMSIDVEGHELNVLEGIDFDYTKINVLTIENNPKGYKKQGDDKIRKFMIKQGYTFWGRIIKLDDIYVHKSYLDTLKDPQTV